MRDLLRLPLWPILGIVLSLPAQAAQVDDFAYAAAIELSASAPFQRVELPPVRANRERLRINALLVGSFFIGGLSGALGFKHFGFLSTVPLAALLLTLALVPMADDLRLGWRLWRRRR